MSTLLECVPVEEESNAVLVPQAPVDVISPIDEDIHSNDTGTIKVIMPYEENKEFFEEMREALDHCSTEEAHDIRDNFENVTGGLHIDDYIEHTTPQSVESVPVPPGDIIEAQAELATNTSEAQYNESLEHYLKNPLDLKLKYHDAVKLNQLGILDKNSISMLIDAFNNDVDMLYEALSNPESALESGNMYCDHTIYRDTIIANMRIVTDLRDSITITRDLLKQNKLIEKLFDFRFPSYAKEGPACLLNEFIEHIDHHMQSLEYQRTCFKDLSSEKKMKLIIKLANEQFFGYITNTMQTDPYDLSRFASSVWVWNKPRLIRICNITDETEATPQRFDSLLMTFLYLFNRFCKRRFAKIATDVIEIKFFRKFLFDNANQSYLSEVFAHNLDAAWIRIWNICAGFATECSNRINARKAQLDAAKKRKLQAQNDTAMAKDVI